MLGAATARPSTRRGRRCAPPASPRMRAVVVERDRHLRFLRTRVRRGHEVLPAVLDHFTGRAEQARRERERGLLAPDVDLLPERAADVGHDHVHLRDGETRGSRRSDPRALCAPWLEIQIVMSPPRGIPARDRAARLHRHRDVAVLADRLGDDVGGGRRTRRRARDRRVTWWCGRRWTRAPRAPSSLSSSTAATRSITAGRGRSSTVTSSHASSASGPALGDDEHDRVADEAHDVRARADGRRAGLRRGVVVGRRREVVERVAPRARPASAAASAVSMRGDRGATREGCARTRRAACREGRRRRCSDRAR